MIAHIRGKLVEKTPTYVVIEANGVGYGLSITLHTFSTLEESELVMLYTYFIVRDDAQILYGFSTQAEREMFKLLISVSGVGPSIARTMLSSMTTQEVQQAIASGNVGIIQSVKGIGAKTAQRVIVDLKDKVLTTAVTEELSGAKSNTQKIEALSALEVLGFAKKQSEKIIDKILADNPTLSVEQLIKNALKNL